jgi:hypothetical protein
VRVQLSRCLQLTRGVDVSGDRHLGRVSRSSAGDPDLRARDEGLRGDDVKADLFDADKVLIVDVGE